MHNAFNCTIATLKLLQTGMAWFGSSKMKCFCSPLPALTDSLPHNQVAGSKVLIFFIFAAAAVTLMGLQNGSLPAR